jgi:hypothetical protein
MKTLLKAALAAVLIVPAFAGDALVYRCDNMCPLAQTANTHRAYGLEARTMSKVARADVAAVVESNLLKV